MKGKLSVFLARGGLLALLVLCMAASGRASSPTGAVLTWGQGAAGQLGDGTFYTNSPYGSSTPVEASGLSDVVAVAAGFEHSLALKSDGTVWAWGYGEYGQLGDGSFYTNSTIGSATPVEVSGLSGVVAVAGGGAHSLAVSRLSVTGLSPATALLNGPAFALTVNGTGFVPGDVVNWNGSPRSTTFVSSTQLTAAIGSSDLAAAGPVNITVTNPAPSVDTSNTLVLTVGIPSIKVQESMTRDTTTNEVQVTLTISNTGTADAANVQVTAATLGTTPTTTSLTDLGTLAAGTSTTTTLSFPGTVGAKGSGSALKIAGSYTGGTFSAGFRVSLP